MRLVALVAITMAAVWFGFVDNDWLDRRPVQRVLFLGHSYTYSNDMPSMVARMADSAGSNVRYDIVTQAFPNASLEEHWKNPTTRSLLAQGDWDRIVVQPDTYFQALDADNSYFLFGSRLLGGTGRTPPAVVVSWLASEGFYPDRPVTRLENLRNTERNHRGLALRTGAQLIDVARIWEDVSGEGLPFSLYSDGNHPSLEGTYLAALVVYAELSQTTDVGDVTYVPWRMSGDNAALLRDRVQQALRARGMAGFAGAAHSSTLPAN